MTFELSNYDYDPFFDFFLPTERRSNTGLSMKTDVTEDDHNYYMEVELAGVKKEDINLTLKDGYLTITAKRENKNDQQNRYGKWLRHERYYGTTTRSFYVGLEDEKNIAAKFENGVLTISFPKEEEKKELVRKIDIR